MNVLVLGPFRMNLYEYLIRCGDNVEFFEDNIDLYPEKLDNIDFLVSYGYRYIIKKNVLDQFKYRAINLHISFLPWNRGADPNLWSFLENTVKGVTIHYIDEGLDTGDILCQKQIHFSGSHTLRTTYEILTTEIERLFVENWPEIKAGKIVASPQIGTGSFHKKKDKEPYLKYLTKGWDTPICEIEGKALGQLKSERG